MYTAACLRCYCQIKGRCEHLRVEVTEVLVRDVCTLSSARRLQKALAITCQCGQRGTGTFRTGAQYRTYQCSGCENSLLYSTSNTVLSAEEIHKRTKLPFPVRQCPLCAGSKKRTVNRFVRCENCDGTGGRKGIEDCAVCHGECGIVAGSVSIDCQECKENI